MIRPHLAHEPLRFDSVDMLRLEVRWVDVEGQWDGRDGTKQKERALFCLYLGLHPPDKSQPWPPQAECRVGGQCLSNNLACWAAQVPWLQAAAWASPHLFFWCGRLPHRPFGKRYTTWKLESNNRSPLIIKQSPRLQYPDTTTRKYSYFSTLDLSQTDIFAERFNPDLLVASQLAQQFEDRAYCRPRLAGPFGERGRVVERLPTIRDLDQELGGNGTVTNSTLSGIGLAWCGLLRGAGSCGCRPGVTGRLEPYRHLNVQSYQ